MVVMVVKQQFVHVHITSPIGRSWRCSMKASSRVGGGFQRVRNVLKVDILGRGERECGSERIVFSSLFHEASISRIENLSRGVATSVLAMALCVALDTFPCDAAYAVSPNAEDGMSRISSSLTCGPSRSCWGASQLYKKSYLMQALLQNSDGGIESSGTDSPTKENVGAGAETFFNSTGVIVENGNSATQQTAAEKKKKETIEDQNAIKKKIKWLNEVTSQITEELNDVHPPPLKGQVEQARGKVSTELSAISGSMSNVASDLKEGFVGLKDTITSIASQEGEKQKASAPSGGSGNEDDGHVVEKKNASAEHAKMEDS